MFNEHMVILTRLVVSIVAAVFLDGRSITRQYSKRRSVDLQSRAFYSFLGIVGNRCDSDVYKTADASAQRRSACSLMLHRFVDL